MQPGRILHGGEGLTSGQDGFCPACYLCHGGQWGPVSASQPSVGTMLSAPRSWCCTNVLSESASADWTPWVYLVAVQGLVATPQAARTVSVSQNKGAGVEAELALKAACGPEGEEVLL